MIDLILRDYYSIADWSKAAAGYAKEQKLDLRLVNAFAGVFAILPCVFENGFFAIDFDEGEPGAVIEALGDDGETTLDLVAWPTRKPDQFATVLNNADALGIGNVTNPASWAFDNQLHVHRTPLSWLKAGCSGCCILDHRYVAYWLGQALGPIVAESREHASALSMLLNPRFDERRILFPKAMAA